MTEGQLASRTNDPLFAGGIGPTTDADFGTIISAYASTPDNDCTSGGREGMFLSPNHKPPLSTKKCDESSRQSVQCMSLLETEV